MAAAGRAARLVHVSSDAVFSGAQVHYDEAATPAPITPLTGCRCHRETFRTPLAWSSRHTRPIWRRPPLVHMGRTETATDRDVGGWVK
ncbi:hypothetical protein [Nocardiopsis trehalosi]|uniref:hypothetical protein n=1 Tax=Nocardiopsis trehalosi TaxID=109329 RepID=UPI0034E1D0EE